MKNKIERVRTHTQTRALMKFTYIHTYMVGTYIYVYINKDTYIYVYMHTYIFSDLLELSKGQLFTKVTTSNEYRPDS